MSAGTGQPVGSPPQDHALAARRILRTALKGSLATIDGETGHPYASLVLTATEPGGSPILLISRLARHTRNLEGDARASLLLDATGSAGDPLEGGRLTLIGEVGPSASPSAVARFLARHPEAEAYAAFPDFSAYVMRVLQGHYIGGFGRIVGLPAADLCTDTAEAASLMAAETGILEHMNSDHPDAVALYATSLAGQPPGAWRMVGIDPDGIDLRSGEHVARIEFPAPVLTPDAARAALVALVQKARAG